MTTQWRPLQSICLLRWAALWSVSSAWVIWARCMHGGSATRVGGKCYPSTNEDTAFELPVPPFWYVHTLPSYLHHHPIANDDLSAFGSSIALRLVDRPFWSPSKL
ncbi:uncharacterized protein BCR38DRAFT_423460 [Pseudomassariella vexata]|uniref:Secreted protein n=1 Tax=Pseudomassariella vexata TaxID=1141098 RepID=A0A1Y2EAA9_9PEZI|nr:uncharacterized protein BCR38DRAFT_423460 [Pseudomassariella vexata]ORY68501.1 hypothetical protein BCR38DRAFT_423460 [Pseudomassariella vexata]